MVAALVVWIVIDVAVGTGPWTATGRYAVGLFGRAGPTRDLARAVGSMVGRRPARPITLRVWDWWSPSTTEDYARYFAELEEIFEREHPDVDVVFQAIPFTNFEQKLATGTLGSNPPDVFQCSAVWAQGLYQRGILRELNEFVAVTPELQDDKFMESALYHTRGEDGRIFGIPHIVDSICLLWNLDKLKADPALHDMFERKADGTPDFRRIRFEAVRDWEHFRSIAKRLTKITDSERTQSGFGISAHGAGPGTLMPWAAANGVKFQDRAGTKALFDTPAAAEAMQFLVDLYWTDRVSPPFRRELASHEQFQTGDVACAQGGTWDGKYLVRNTQGWMGFGMTAFPPGPQGAGQKTITWANMMAISSRSKHPEVAWEYIKLNCDLRGSLLKLKYLNQNSPRLDFYEQEGWAAEIEKRPYLSNIRRICESGDPLFHTETRAVGDELQPIFEYVLLNWPDIKSGRGRVRDVADALHLAAELVNGVYRRYGRLVRGWDRQLGRAPKQGEE